MEGTASLSPVVQGVVAWLFPAGYLTKELIVVLVWLAFGKVALGLAWEGLLTTSTMRSHRVFKIQIPADQRLREIRSSWHVVSDAVVLYVLTRFGLIQLAADTLANSLLTFAVFYAWVEVWYYATHRWMHANDFLYRVHRSHHLTRVVTPLSSISMSWVEKWVFYTCGWLGFVALASWVVPISLYGIAAYYAFHFIISLHGHSNTEPTRLGCLMSRLGMGSATSHALHHARFRVNYGFSNMLLDRLLGTYSNETETLQRKAVEKAGAETLKSTPLREIPSQTP